MTYKVAIIMGSRSDLDAMKEAANVLDIFGIEYEIRALSAHRTPQAVQEFIIGLADRGFAAVIAGAGGAAHLAGVCAAHTHLPVIGVPMKTSFAGGLDSLLSTVQMPRGIPVATTATGGAGAYNAALLAVAMIGLADPQVQARYIQFRQDQTAKVLEQAEITL
ncbi:MAG: 5-(carboxyamino)imidazole ribonucleotide mutase [Actinomycetaceae bacterium]|nr:5-(carboxyamino)imidazole ribonucleotide mutase [Arcanobacterium sp.]MDD7504328.1 5-(carboxyamino)imidazole ribonucleotide mutase [Actinomycetaceae bacterium]MDY6143923.1 5-(carboxyamino)imidazole ribonucleotide mutase [Arcanobacterium sp.]